MAVTYVVIPKLNPQDREAAPKFYATSKSRGELTFRNLSKEIAEGSTTVSDTDVLAVLNDLTKILRRHLENGEIVRFGDFGSFQVSVKSEGAESEQKFHSSLIKSAKVTFRPGIDLREMLNNLKYEKLP
ncbi:HU family DNA-binding protein [Mangrovibacterium marinum]|uniref:Putative histone-like DNA-binding protein n=1 Tax=Mangrovibacterium marinum TaxID=1639118 RepID=A0A2T5C1A9_9BACT|nr:HU family DNA-binding protein [Mangrovibacterium marinum]PTN08407.1 putative histone-like DNA-binding protein [Mangrovibacterium marinum]